MDAAASTDIESHVITIVSAVENCRIRKSGLGFLIGHAVNDRRLESKLLITDVIIHDDFHSMSFILTCSHHRLGSQVLRIRNPCLQAPVHQRSIRWPRRPHPLDFGPLRQQIMCDD